jgi:hypothetical protein
MGDVIGLTPVPDDKSLSEFIQEVIVQDNNYLVDTLEELQDVIESLQENNNYSNFAYAKLLNYLNPNFERADDLEPITQNELIHLCAASLWYLNTLGNIPERSGDGT